MFRVPMKMGIASSVVPRDLVNNEGDLETILKTGTTDSEGKIMVKEFIPVNQIMGQKERS